MKCETEVVTVGGGRRAKGRGYVNSGSCSVVCKDMDELRSVEKFVVVFRTVLYYYVFCVMGK